MHRIRCKSEAKDHSLSPNSTKLPFALQRRAQQRRNEFVTRHITTNKGSLSNNSKIKPQLHNSSQSKVEPLKIGILDSPKAETAQSQQIIRDNTRTSFPVMRPRVSSSLNKSTNGPRCHNPQDKCFCGLCDCGRHLCRLDKRLQGNFHGSSTYFKDYIEKQRKYDLKKEPDQGQTYPQKPTMYMSTTYSKDFQTREPQPKQQAIPSQQKAINGGPLSAFTSYNTQYVRRVGDNQYVRFKDNVHMNGILSFNGKTVYNRTFKDADPGIRIQPFKPSDNVKIGGYWLGKTTYQRCYQKPNETQKTMNFAVEEKFQTIPSFTKQFQSTYAKNFETYQPPRQCPAKTALHNSRIQMNLEERMNLPSNTDYKDFEYASRHLNTTPY